jgi:membrane protein
MKILADKARFWGRFLYDTYLAWSKDHASFLAAGLSYFALFSIAPVIILSTAIIGQLWSHASVQQTVLEKLGPVLGDSATESLTAFLKLAKDDGKGKASLLSFVVLYLAASRIFAQLRTALDIIWDITPPKTSFFRNILRTTVKNLLMVLGVVAFLFLFLATDALMAGGLKFLQTRTVGYVHLPLIAAVHFAVPLLLFTLLFAAIYKVLPDTRIPWSDVWPGALLTAGLFSVGKSLISLYLTFQKFDSVYGAASSVIIIMVWIYLASQILFFGAEFTWLYAKRYGSRSKPEPLPLPK